MSDGPTLAGYTALLRQQGFSTQYLPDNSPYIGWSYNVALELVNQQILAASSLIYKLAVYNLATSNMLSWAQDQTGQTFFSDLRKKWNLDDFIPGVISATSDEGTSESMEVMEQLKALTISNLQNLKDPWGRAYLGFAQSVGSLWGLS